METFKEILDTSLNEDTAVAAVQQAPQQTPQQNPQQTQQPVQPDPNEQKKQQAVAKIEQMVLALQKEIAMFKQLK